MRIINTIKAGIYPDMSAEAYHGDPAPAPSLSSTLAKELLGASPLHAWVKSPRLNPFFERENKAAFDIGTACHAMLTGVGMSKVVRVDADDWRTKDAKAERDAAYEKGLTPLLAEQHERTTAMMEAARYQLRLNRSGDPFDGGRCEVSVFAEIEDVWCRCRPDVLVRPGEAPDTKRGVIYDYKTTAERANPASFARTAANLGYDVQAAHYIDTVAAIEGGQWLFRLIVQEKSDPFGLCVIELDEAWLEMGRRKMARAREVWRHCLETETWPGYPAEVCVCPPPHYHYKDWFEREEREADYRARTGKDVLAALMQWQAPVEASP